MAAAKDKIFRTFLVVALLCAGVVSAETIFSKVDLRLWQTVHDRSAPIAWPWADGAEAATLVFSNRVTHVVSSGTVLRGTEETHGHHAHPPVAAGREAIFDVTLEQTGGGRTIVREVATLAYVSGAGGGPIAVRVRDSREWEVFSRPRVHAIDPAWWGESGDSGYGVAPPTCSGMYMIFR